MIHHALDGLIVHVSEHNRVFLDLPTDKYSQSRRDISSDVTRTNGFSTYQTECFEDRLPSIGLVITEIILARLPSLDRQFNQRSINAEANTQDEPLEEPVEIRGSDQG